MPEAITLRIAGKEFTHWSSLEILSSVDRPAMFRVIAPARPADADFRESFRPFQFLSTDVALDGARIITGTQVNIFPEDSGDAQVVTAEGFALPGMLADVCMPPESWPLEFAGQRIGAIATALCAAFGLSVAPIASEGAAFERVRLEPTERVLGALSRLAQQRGLLVSSAAGGELLLQRATAPGSPAFTLGPSDAPRGGLRARFDAQSYFSHITGIQQARMGRPGSFRTAANPFASGLLRPHVFAEDSSDGDSPTAVDATLGRMIASAARYSLTLPGWRDPNGALLRPNTTLRLLDPHSMIYTETEFLTRSVRLVASPSGRYAELELVLPGAFTGALPEVAPWDG